MKKNRAVCGGLGVVVIIVGLICVFKWSAIQERLMPLQYNSAGKDTVLTLGNGQFEIGKFGNMKVLLIHQKDGSTQAILNDVIAYQKRNGTLYVVSSRGYAVVNGIKNIAQVFYTSTIAEKDNIDYVRQVSNISILSSYHQFDDKTKKMFQSMQKK